MSPRHAPGDSDPAALQRLLDGENAATRQRVRAILSRPDFRYYTGNDTAEYRQIVFRWCRPLAAENLGALALPREYGGEADFAKFMAAFETIATHDISLAIKFTVQFGFVAGQRAVVGHGKTSPRVPARHRQSRAAGLFRDDRNRPRLQRARPRNRGAFMNRRAGEFVIHSPGFAAGKNYIGNGVCHGRAATVFAQLETGGARRGVHAFVVPIRDAAGRSCRACALRTTDRRWVENGVDNARLWFDRVRVPREALLDRFASVAAGRHLRQPDRQRGRTFFRDDQRAGRRHGSASPRPR